MTFLREREEVKQKLKGNRTQLRMRRKTKKQGNEMSRDRPIKVAQARK